MPKVGFESTVEASARAKTFHALDRSATVTGVQKFTLRKYFSHISKITGLSLADDSVTNTQRFYRRKRKCWFAPWICISSLEYWNVLCPVAQTFGEMVLNLRVQLQFIFDLEQNIFWILTLASKVSLSTYVENVTQDGELEK
jgi:hypothetical protein